MQRWMAVRPEAHGRRPPPRFYIVTETVDDAGFLTRALDAVLGSADVAAVLLRLPGGDERSLIRQVKAVASAVQSRDCALLLADRADLVARSGADGAHLRGAQAFKAALEYLKPNWIAGAGDLHTRHDAMLAGEAGADYLMFGEPDVENHRPAFSAVLDRVEWWSEVFETPCVGFAADLDEVEPLAARGAEFVALGKFVWRDPRGPAAVVRAAAERVSCSELM